MPWDLAWNLWSRDRAEAGRSHIWHIFPNPAFPSTTRKAQLPRLRLDCWLQLDRQGSGQTISLPTLPLGKTNLLSLDRQSSGPKVLLPDHSTQPTSQWQPYSNPTGPMAAQPHFGRHRQRLLVATPGHLRAMCSRARLHLGATDQRCQPFSQPVSPTRRSLVDPVVVEPS